jgi:hypothetical protein
LPTPLSTLTAKIQEAFQAHPEKKWVKASIDTLYGPELSAFQKLTSG